MSLPVVSVHMITYNHEPYIRQAIDSVLSQQVDFPFEIVIGEDCSRDNTRALALAYQERHPSIVRVITSGSNVGMMKNAHRTFEATRGKYVAYCEADDYWQDPLKLQKQVRFLEQNPRCSLVCSDYDVLYEDTGRHDRYHNRSNGLDPGRIGNVRKIIRGTPSSGILTCTVMARRNLLVRAVEKNADLLAGDTPQPSGDTPLWAALFVEGPVGYIDESMATYRRVEVSATRNPSKAGLLRTSIAMKRQMLQLSERFDVPESEQALHRRDLQLRLLRLAYFERDRAAAMEAARALPSLSMLDRLLLFGARPGLTHHLTRPIVNCLARPLIPTVGKP